MTSQMKRANSESDAMTARDLSIEAMALVDRTVFHAKKSCGEAFFNVYRSACGSLMGEFGDVINRAAFDFPALLPTEETWRQVATSRVGAGEPGEAESGEVRRILARVRECMDEIRALAPRLTSEPERLTAAFDRVERVASEWS